MLQEKKEKRFTDFLMLVPLLRVPSPCDLQASLARWLDAMHQGFAPDAKAPDFTATECIPDLQRIHSLRQKLEEQITSATSYHSATAETSKVLQEYHATLLECENRGFPKEKDPCNIIALEWLGTDGQRDRPYSGFLYERASCMWNLAALEAHNASQQDFNKKQGWMKANKALQAASGFMHHLNQLMTTIQQPNNNTNFDNDFSKIAFWEAALQAQAQMAGYQMANSGARPKHLLLAKLATAAGPLWTKAVDACSISSPERTTAAAWSALMSSKAEYHESVTHKDKNKSGMEIARLERALTYGQTAQEAMRCGEAILDDRLQRDLPDFLQQVQDRYAEAQQTNTEPIPTDVRDIRGEVLSKGPIKLPKTMVDLPTPLFTNLLGPAARQAIAAFNREMKKFIFEMSNMVEEKTEAARKSLAGVNLPHSLTAYKQEQSGGGIPMDLWERVDAIQKDRKISMLKSDLWGLRDVAEQARSIFTKTQKQLDEDVEMDGMFREQNPSFEGHDVEEIQRSFRTSMANYEKLLAKSQEGDSVLLRRLEILDTEPKYKLLQFQKSQLDRLLPGTGGNQAPKIDTTHLSRLLVELSTLFHDREVTLNMLREEVKNYNIRAKIAEVNPDSPTLEQDYHQRVIMAQKSFSGIAYEIQLNIDKQAELVETILQENERFMDAREKGASSAASDSCIAMIEDAIEETDQLTKHLKEGKDFYNVVIPKLQQLKQQVGDASVRLTVERCEFEDQAQDSEERRRQEMEDARMAASLAENNEGGEGGGGEDGESSPRGGSGDVAPAASQPGVVNVSHAEPQVRVDDEKVANLVAMDFDPDKVVEALRKYDNNMEQALNELLSC